MVNKSKTYSSVLILLIITASIFFVYNSYKKRVVIVESDDNTNIPASEYIPVTALEESYDMFKNEDYLNIVSISPEVGFETGLKEYPRLTWETQEIIEKEARVSISMKYPHFLGNNKVTNLNKYIESRIKKTIEEDRELLKSLVNSEPESYLSSLDLSAVYRLVGVVDGVVSLELVITDFTGGGNGNHDESITINWDLKSDKLLTVDQLFCSKNYIEVLVPLVRKQIISDFEKSPHIRKPLDDSIIHLINEGTKADKDNWGHFLINKEGLIVVFPSYQVSSGSSGIVRTFIANSSIPNLVCLQ